MSYFFMVMFLVCTVVATALKSAGSNNWSFFAFLAIMNQISMVSSAFMERLSQ